MCLITGTTFHLVLSILNYYILIVHFWVKFSWFSVKALTTNEATLPTFTCSASSNHKNIIHKLTKYCSTTNVYPPPQWKLPAIRYTLQVQHVSQVFFCILPFALKFQVSCKGQYFTQLLLMLENSTLPQELVSQLNWQPCTWHALEKHLKL